MTYLLDTNWIIQLLAGHPKTVTFHKGLHPDKLAVSYITVGEIYDVAFAYANPQAHLVSLRQFLALSPFSTSMIRSWKNLLKFVPIYAEEESLFLILIS